MEKYHVELVSSGHDHGIVRTYPIKNGAFKEKTSQGIIYYVAGQSGGKTYSNIERMG
jgi:acid phosphatase type 7